jgi:hypothetical protein
MYVKGQLEIVSREFAKKHNITDATARSILQLSLLKEN